MPTHVDRRQKLCQFFSADIVDSARFKSQSRRSDQGDDHWAKIFQDFFRKFPSVFVKEYQNLTNSRLTPIRLWRTRGDEIIFTAMLTSEEQVVDLCKAFYDAILKMDNDYSRIGGVKGCTWTAGFPIRNVEMKVLVHGDLPKPIPDGADEASYLVAGVPIVIDYLGVDVDAGFRLSQFTSRQQLVVSHDVADFLTRKNDMNSSCIELHHVGWRVLRGCYESRPYPIIWFSMKNRKVEKINSWDGYDDILLSNYFEMEKVPPNEISNLIARYRQDIPNSLIRPYILSKDIDKGHELCWTEGKIPDL